MSSGEITILITQITTLLVYVGIALTLYRLLVKQKDATIEYKNAQIEFLQTQLDIEKKRIPLAAEESLTKRLECAQLEVKRLVSEKENLQKELELPRTSKKVKSREAVEKQVEQKNQLLEKKRKEIDDIEHRIKELRGLWELLRKPVEHSKESLMVLRILRGGVITRGFRMTYRNTAHYKAYRGLVIDICGKTEFAAFLIAKYPRLEEIVENCGYNFVEEEGRYSHENFTFSSYWPYYSSILKEIIFTVKNKETTCRFMIQGSHIKLNSLALKRLHEMHNQLRSEAQSLVESEQYE